MALGPRPLEQLWQRPLERRRRQVIKSDFPQGYALLALVVSRDELVEEADTECGGALGHGRGVLARPRHPGNIEVGPRDITDKALDKLRAEDAASGATAANILHVSGVAVD